MSGPLAGSSEPDGTVTLPEPGAVLTPATIRAGALSPAEFARIADVSRETLDRLQLYADLLAKWQVSINLVASSTLSDVWRRHMLDSAQLTALMPSPGGPVRAIADLGSGAGFPGLVLAIATGRPTFLIDADSRKCAFLREAVRVTGAPATVINARIESLASKTADHAVDVLVARALAPLEKLCFFAHLLKPRCCLFLKGRNWRDELTAAEERWTMQVESFASLSAPSARVLRIGGVAPTGNADSRAPSAER